MSSLEQGDTIFQALLQDLPEELMALAYEFQAFTRARKVRDVPHLLRLVLLSCGLDCSWRATAGISAELRSPLSDEAVRQRLPACPPWLTALLQQLLPAPPVTALPATRLILVDGCGGSSGG